MDETKRDSNDDISPLVIVTEATCQPLRRSV